MNQTGPTIPEQTPDPSRSVPTADSIGERPGDVLGPYTLLAPIGEGGFGAVFLAEQSRPLQRRVAIKLIKPGLDTRAVIARFEAERQALAILDHPNIAKVFDAGATAHGRPYFVMEFVPGVSITQHCDAERLSINERLALFAKVCDAVAHAHTKGIIHRDLKPSNILVSELETGERVPKIIDFGVAKATQRLSVEHTLFTERGVMIGTPEYMSPEQADASARDIDTRTDVYALGVILYELLTGTLPFDQQTLRAAGFEEIRRIIREVEPPRPSTRFSETGPAAAKAAEARRLRLDELERTLRNELEWIPLKAMRKERHERYRSVSDLGDDVRNYLGGRPLLAAPESSAYRVRKFVRRHRTGVLGAAAVAATLVAGLAFSLYALGRAAQARRETEVVTTFLSDMLASPDPSERGHDISMRTVLDHASGTIGESFRGMPGAEARLRRTIGNAYRGLGEFDRAEAHLQGGLELRRRTLGPHHRDTVRALGDLAGLRHEQGRYDESERLSLEAIAEWRGPADDAVLLGIRQNLAQTYTRQGRINEAVTLQHTTVESMRRTLGPAHEHTLGATINLATLLQSQDKAAESESLLKRTIEDWTNAHGGAHPGTLLARTQLAGLYLDLRRNDDAERIYRESLLLQREVQGPEHPATARTECNLAIILVRLDRVPEALSLLEHAWSAMRAALGEAHPDTLSTAVTLLEQYDALGWPESAAERTRSLLRAVRICAQQAKADPRTLNSCAWFLLTARPESLREPGPALVASTAACEQARAAKSGSLWEFLDTLALAQSLSGDHRGAVASQREAISLLPRSGETYRAEMEGRLRQYEKAAAGG